MSGCGQGKYKVILEHFVIPESKEVFNTSEDNENHLEGAPLAKAEAS